MGEFIDKIRKKMDEQKKKALIKSIREKGTSYSGKTGKKILSSTETVTLSGNTERIINEVKEGVSAINKSSGGDAQKLLSYIEAQGTKIYKIKNAAKVLEKINEHTGFITGLEGAKAVYVSSVVGGLATKTEPIFIISSDKEVDYYMLLREVYLWYAYNKGLGGFDFKSQELFKKYMNNNKNPELSNLKYEDMCALQEAISRDSEANDFVMNCLREKEGSANVLKKMKDGGAEI